METAVLIVIVGLWVLGSLVPAGHTLPQEMARLRGGRCAICRTQKKISR